MVSPSASLSPRTQAILNAREALKHRPCYLDTETTGLEKTDEIIEIAIIDDDGNLVVESFVKATQPIPPAATNIHKINAAMLQGAPIWPMLWPQIRTKINGNLLAIYNAEFDLRLMEQSMGRYRLPWRENLQSFCVMKLYAQFNGDWDPMRRAYRNVSLDRAGKDCHISLPNAHRAVADTLLTRALLHYMADSTF
jgi:DNA polymerase-3 subunit epsilon